MKYPAAWPDGTLKTLHTPFNWEFEIVVKADHLKTSERASEPSECVTAFNQWRTAMEAAPKSTPEWPDYLADYNRTAEAKGARVRRQDEISEQVPQHQCLHSLSGSESITAAKDKRSKLRGKPNHARSQ